MPTGVHAEDMIVGVTQRPAVRPAARWLWLWYNGVPRCFHAAAAAFPLRFRSRQDAVGGFRGPTATRHWVGYCEAIDAYNYNYCLFAMTFISSPASSVAKSFVFKWLYLFFFFFFEELVRPRLFHVIFVSRLRAEVQTTAGFKLQQLTQETGRNASSCRCS